MSPRGRVFVASGHGGTDPGATVSGLVERDLNATVAARLTERLRHHELDVVCDLDHGNPAFAGEVELARDVGSIEYYLAVHHNSATDPALRGAETFSEGDGMGLASAMQQAQLGALRTIDPALPDRKAKQARGSGAAKHVAQAPGLVVVLEPCFMSSPADREILRHPEYVARLAEAWCRALVDHGRSNGSWTATYRRRDVTLPPRFSVIVPTCDRPELLGETVRSILAQTVTDLEVLVVDDGIHHVAPDFDDERVRVLRPGGGRGPAAARNSGLDAATGHFVAFLDDDDLWTPDRLDLALRGLERAPVSVCWTRHIGSNATPRHRSINGTIGDQVLDDTTPCLGATAADRSLVPRFDDRWLAIEDVIWWRKLAGQAAVATVPRVGYLVRRHDGERGRNPNSRRVSENLQFLKDERSFFGKNRRAAAHRWRRVCLLAWEDRNYPIAVAAGLRSFRANPRIPGLLRRRVGSVLRSIGLRP